MFTIYILQDESGCFYKGMTSNLNRRLAEHRTGGVKTTRKMKEFKVVYTEEYQEVDKARAREKYFKTAAGRRFIRALVNKGH